MIDTKLILNDCRGPLFHKPVNGRPDTDYNKQAFAHFFSHSRSEQFLKQNTISFVLFSPLPFPGKILLRILADTIQFKVHLSLAMKFSVRCQYFRKTRINHISKCLIMSSPQTPFQGGGCIYRKK